MSMIGDRSILDQYLDEIKKEHRREKTGAIVERWREYVAKVEERVDEILQESEPGLNEIIPDTLLDPEPFLSALTLVDSRLQKISRKVDEGGDKLAEELDELQEGVSGSELDALIKVESRLQKEAEKLQTGIEKRGEKLRSRAIAAWAGESARLALDETGKNSKCSSCAAELEVVLRSQASAVKCPYCGTVNNIEPGRATMWYYNLGVDALAHEAVRSQFEAAEKAEDLFMDRREPSAAEFQKLIAMVEDAWQAYYQKLAELHPDHAHLGNGLEAAVAAKVKSFRESRDWGV